jgi:prepilin-type N-terminal cleavage/methylation domain-containing protein
MRRKQSGFGRPARLSEANGMRHRNDGFTLIETLIAVVIFAIMSLAMTSLMVTNTRMISENAQSSEAIGYAQELLENLRQVSVDSLSAGSKSATRQSARGTVYTITWTVTPNTPSAGRTSVAVTVAWDHKGSPRSYATQSIFTQVSS